MSPRAGCGYNEGAARTSWVGSGGWLAVLPTRRACCLGHYSKRGPRVALAWTVHYYPRSHAGWRSSAWLDVRLPGAAVWSW